ncbi:hypothetical protein SELMODRAFT_234441 [Selaginella moellendorffii]|uniref:Glucan endo-1,3-beta-D-glucosidase n=1 Tax=Selaginella moellendorffii TaxID=88036 RepID=D8SL80_SELML|nr:hypothetical protein SELMODRAFT_234441 [Selaginella moellendorffii]
MAMLVLLVLLVVGASSGKLSYHCGNNHQKIAAGAERFGINYGRVADDLPSPLQVAALAKRENITHIKIFDADPVVLQAFRGTDVGVVVTVPNDEIPAVAANLPGARFWFDAYASPFIAEITTILVGNEVLKFSPHMSTILVPAMQNLYQILRAHDLADKIKISTPHAMDVLEKNSSSPPSNGMFRQQHVSTMQNLLEFLSISRSFFVLNVYPYFAFREDKGATLSAEFALLQSPKNSVTDPNTSFRYSNLLDAQLDAVYAAIEKLGYMNLRIVIGETGWPTAGGFGATMQNAAIFMRNIICRTQDVEGTPARPAYTIQAFVFSMFNEDLKHNLMEQNFGLFYPNMTKVYPLKFSSDCK